MSTSADAAAALAAAQAVQGAGGTVINLKKQRPAPVDFGESTNPMENEKYTFLTPVSMDSLNIQRIGANSVSDSQVTWTFQNSPLIVLTRRPYVRLRFRVYPVVDPGATSNSASATPKSWAELQGVNNVGFRQYPVHSCMVSSQLVLDSTVYSYSSPHYTIHALTSTYDRPDRVDHMMSIAFPDQQWSYNTNDFDVSGSSSPFARWDNAIAEPARRRLQDWAVARTDGTFDTGVGGFYQVDVYEELFTSPGKPGKECPGFVQVNTFGLTYNLTNLARILSGTWSGGWVSTGAGTASTSTANAWKYTYPGADPGSSTLKVTGVRVILDPNPQEHIIYMNQFVPSQMQKIPDVVVYDHYTTILYQTPYSDTLFPLGNSITGTPAPSSNNNIVSSLFSVGSVPSRIFLFIRPTAIVGTYDYQSNPPASALVAVSDTTQQQVELPNYFLRIDSIEVTLNGRPGIFSSFETQDLWRVSVKNGLKFGMQAWLNYRGSVLILNPVEDIGGFGETFTSSSAGNWQFQFKINATNISRRLAVQYELDVVFVQAGFSVARDLSYSQVTSFITPGQLAVAPFVQPRAVGSGSGPVGAGAGGGADDMHHSGFKTNMGSGHGPSMHALGGMVHRAMQRYRGSGSASMPLGGSSGGGCRRGGGAETISVADL